ncbi:rhodanese-like domain-containing protein [Robertkochia sediminum]|uniref:rhodanese-like domain-containing protein n=1 Tax=Robertkochia sediminum TaxID=2785326 RepID=UPI0019321ABD|nr:rhodanese-like domain-containing protein [Robertkochia sediminum]MBL7472842.1 rhodanese-like domain-containing protein [Robertkochia sediminum]
MKKIFLFAALLFSAGLFAQVNNISITEVPETLWEEGVLIDVRTPGEWEEGVVPGATLINFYDEDFVEKVSRFSKDKKLLLYCRSGRRSADASALLDSLGYKEVYNLEGGYVRWEAARQKEAPKEKDPQKADEGFWGSFMAWLFD